jgi:hypothetical protein
MAFVALCVMTAILASDIATGQLLPNPFAALMPASSQPTCRMEPGAAHDFCGLPYELSNFQGVCLVA